MRVPSRSAILAAASLVAVLVATAPAHAAPCSLGDAQCTCAATIVKEYGKYVKAKTKIVGKCNDTSVKDGNGNAAPGGGAGACSAPLATCDPDGKVATAAQKFRDKVNKKCQDEGVAPAAVNWPTGPNACPNFEAGSCTYPISTSDDIATCLLCVADKAICQTMDLYYSGLLDPGLDSDLVKCQRAIGKESTKFLLAKDKNLRKCRKAVDKGDITGPCPDGLAQAAIDKAESKKVVKICKACDTASVDGVTCTGPDTFTPAQIGVTDCPDVQVPGGGAPGDCGSYDPINDVTELAKCVDCVTEYKVDCMDRISAPHQTSYPPECLAIVCPTRAMTEANGDAVDLDTGWTGQSHDSHAASMGRVTLSLHSCTNPDPSTCGVCNTDGPIANHGGTGFNNHRCVGDTSIQCTADSDCGGNAPCSFFFGGPLALSSGGVSVCVINQITTSVTGTVDIEAGTTSTLMQLTAGVHTGVDGRQDKPCPNCVNGHCDSGRHATEACVINGQSPLFGDLSLDCPPNPLANVGNLPISLNYSTGTQTRRLSAGSPNCSAPGYTGFKCFCSTCDNEQAAPCSGTRCHGGTNNGVSCGDPSECPGGICTGTSCHGGTNNGVTCTDPSECPGGICTTECTKSCRGGTNNGVTCTDPSECPGGICTGGVCGGKRCQGGGNNGTPCAATSQCPGGGCGIAGEATAINACKDGICTPNTPPDNASCNEGTCAAGPFELFCGPHATFVACNFKCLGGSNSGEKCGVDSECPGGTCASQDCAPFNRCVGGSQNGVLGCTVDSQCPGGTCEIQTCSVGHFRECFTDNGVVGTHCFGGTNAYEPCTMLTDCPDQSAGTFCSGGSVSVCGVPYPPVNGTGTGTVGSLFCIAPTSNPTVNLVSGLPGLGRVTLPYTVSFN